MSMMVFCFTLKMGICADTNKPPQPPKKDQSHVVIKKSK